LHIKGGGLVKWGITFTLQAGFIKLSPEPKVNSMEIEGVVTIDE